MSNCATLPLKLVQHGVIHHVQRRQRVREVGKGVEGLLTTHPQVWAGREGGAFAAVPSRRVWPWEKE